MHPHILSSTHFCKQCFGKTHVNKPAALVYTIKIHLSSLLCRNFCCTTVRTEARERREILGEMTVLKYVGCDTHLAMQDREFDDAK